MLLTGYRHALLRDSVLQISAPFIKLWLSLVAACDEDKDPSDAIRVSINDSCTSFIKLKEVENTVLANCRNSLKHQARIMSVVPSSTMKINTLMQPRGKSLQESRRLLPRILQNLQNLTYKVIEKICENAIESLQKLVESRKFSDFWDSRKWQKSVRNFCLRIVTFLLPPPK